MRAFSPSLASTVLLAIAAYAAAQEGKTAAFAPGWKEGESWRGTVKTRMSLLLGSGKENEEPVPVSVGREEAWTFRVLAAAGGVATRAEKQYERCVEVRESALFGGRCERPGFPEGKTFALEQEGGAARASVAAPESSRQAELPAGLSESLGRELGQAILSAFPRDPIPVGHEWIVEGKELAVLLAAVGIESVSSGKAKLKFTGLSVRDGTACAVIEAALEAAGMKEPDGVMETVLDGKGTILFNLDRGRLQQAALNGDAVLTDPATGLKGKGTFEASFETRRTE